MFRLMYEQSVSGSISSSNVMADRDSSSGANDVSVRVRRLSSVIVGTFKGLEVNSAQIDMSGFAHFTSGTIQVEKIGKHVIISCKTDILHPSASVRTASAAIPSWARPSIDKRNIYASNGIATRAFFVRPNGELVFQYYSNGSADNRTSAGPYCTLSYVTD